MEDIEDDEVPEWGVSPSPPDSNMFAPLVDGAVRDSEIVTPTDVAEIHSVEIAPTQLDGVFPQKVEGGTVTESIPAASTMPADSPLPTWINGSCRPVPSGRFAALSHALVVRASSNADAGGRVAVLASSSGCRKRLRVVGHFQRRMSQTTTVPAPQESLTGEEFDMTRGDSRGDTESVEHNAEERL